MSTVIPDARFARDPEPSGQRTADALPAAA